MLPSNLDPNSKPPTAPPELRHLSLERGEERSHPPVYIVLEHVAAHGPHASGELVPQCPQSQSKASRRGTVVVAKHSAQT
jgi:hypothetical protein